MRGSRGRTLPRPRRLRHGVPARRAYDRVERVSPRVTVRDELSSSARGAGAGRERPMASNTTPVLFAHVLLRHGLADDVVLSYVARTFAFDPRRCNATLEAAQLLVRQEAAARIRAGNC